MIKSLRLAVRHISGHNKRRLALVLTLTAAGLFAAGYSALAGQGPSQWCSDNYNNSEIHLLDSPMTLNLEPGASTSNPNYFMTCYSTTPYGSGDTEASGQAFVINTPTTSGTSAGCYSDSAAVVRIDCGAGVGINTSNPTSPSAGASAGGQATLLGTPVPIPGYSVGAGVGCVGGTIAISATDCAWGSLVGVSALGSSGGRIAVGGNGCAWGWYLSVNTQGCSESAVLGISGTGSTNSYGWEPTLPYGVAVSGTGNSYGNVAAVSGTGCATGVIAVSLTGCANGSLLAVSGLGSAYSSEWWFDLSPVCPTCGSYIAGSAVGGGSATAYGTAISPTGNASAYGTAISATGNAGGFGGYNPGWAVSGLGNATATDIGVSGTGCASTSHNNNEYNKDYLAASGTGCADGALVSASGTNTANGGLVAVSGTNTASGGSVLRVGGGEKDVSVGGVNVLDNGNPAPINYWTGYRQCPVFNNAQASRYVSLTKVHTGWADFIENGQIRGTLRVNLIVSPDVAISNSNQEPSCATWFRSDFTYTDSVTNVMKEIPYGSFTSDGTTSARLDYASVDFEIHLTWAGGTPSLFPGPYIDSNHLDCNYWAENPSTQVTVRADNAVVTGAVRGAGGNSLSVKPLQGTGWQSNGQELNTCM